MLASLNETALYRLYESRVISHNMKFTINIAVSRYFHGNTHYLCGHQVRKLLVITRG